MKRLLPFLTDLEAWVEQLIPLKQMTLDSRQVTEGDLFIALKGHQCDGRQFIQNAIEQGAAIILAEAESDQDEIELDSQFARYNLDRRACKVITVPRLAERLSAIADSFYASPSAKLKLIGITGTNGKTTTAQLLAQWHNLLGGHSAVMGTIGNGLYGQEQEAINTTGSAIEVQQNLARFVEQGADFCAMEVSSHGLAQYRVEALQYDLAIFTNLSRDHLDYHHSIAAYEAAKFRLFNALQTKAQVLNADDQVAQNWLSMLPNAVLVSCDPNFTSEHQFVKATKVNFSLQGAYIEFESSWGNGQFHSQLSGAFNVTNILLALAGLLTLGYDLAKLVATASQLRSVTGRMQKVSAITDKNRPLVLVDYAHTPDALQKALQAARLHTKGKLFCVFGCGGDRDCGKRPLMATIAEELADGVIVTNDNPRTEDQHKIVAEIMQGFAKPDNILVIYDREQAIQHAIKHASSADLILIAGKGHENYQIIGTIKHHFSDQEIASKYLSQ
ncbi:UDP-N-acetylmuramoylalanyl-D-glutamate--2,6-diaminopimelate ligase [[Haemophilus] ducreyi]|uniref:UDP-N-acetylmuramoyl-L-alanyl-D-glutamate--2,6-diaminopimelate ligase n=2 Tax=Haemophilus ducreyi TaxID=730 RepID=MURE_HAEDU|nr:UDP-N-acetylmuramoyl-L-alanyl-D-glutamate--2,6-diaminopimelate ligase [[Haemophilus] ducreyi]Q7VP59.1 RecName: Full=UDP-N-acetylmuramoyl-L-alanyl-D-glutamate--2,6-diaminopimelate ligase; AltName: Full=Meso-A2pm-adding enzyme; AltName: Full=Meso-diaminopimelate-adding enzyme; AltName: Full=UDP-MurNAc-L-Ala-D-Glu:meso-diaminopimelate ligase; AltName: Full=UDP-MurNAc-tripeptide synthetase; AltName: Full=UDP-N-acetylmuramyl-tripeptide synthetase [[Haemophilus] ducreyi 35000HP]AAP95228.1 UDP-N-acet